VRDLSGKKLPLRDQNLPEVKTSFSMSKEDQDKMRSNTKIVLEKEH